MSFWRHTWTTAELRGVAELQADIDEYFTGAKPVADDPDSVSVLFSPGHQITDPDEAEALGLTVEARRMRADAWRRSVGLLPPLPIHKEKP